MRNILMIITMLCGALILTPSSGAQAESANAEAQKQKIAIAKFERDLRGLNRIKPLQNPKLKQAEDVLERGILDQTNRDIGEVEDVLIDTQGPVVVLNATFEDLRLRGTKPLNFIEYDIKPVGTSYKLAQREEDLIDNLPTLLNGIQTAAGAENGIISLKNLLGRDVSTKGAHNFAEISDVIFTEDTLFVQALHLTISRGTIRRKGVAVPLDAFTFDGSGQRYEVNLKAEFADSLFDYVEED